MRGFSDTLVKPFPQLVQHKYSEFIDVIARDHLSAKRALDIVTNAMDFELLVIQIGIGDSLKKRLWKKPANYSGKNVVFQRLRLDGTLTTYRDRPKIDYLKRHLMDLLFDVGYFQSRTSESEFVFTVRAIQSLAKSREFKILWLGSIVGKNTLSNRELQIRNRFCRDIFMELSLNSDDSMRFIDTNHLLHNSVGLVDVFHLNQEGHEQLSNLILEELETWEL